MPNKTCSMGRRSAEAADTTVPELIDSLVAPSDVCPEAWPDPVAAEAETKDDEAIVVGEHAAADAVTDGAERVGCETPRGVATSGKAVANKASSTAGVSPARKGLRTMAPSMF